MPIEPPEGEMIAVFHADHLAVKVEQRAAELPRLIAASVWM